MLRTAEELGSEDLAVVLGATDPEVIKLISDTVKSGDPTWAGPLAGVPLNMPVYHIFEDEMKAQIPPAVYAEKVGNLEILHDVERVAAATAATRAGAEQRE